jgi:hypothetical protein
MKANAAIVAVACISIASYAETACERHNWRTPGGNFGVVELSLSGSMRDAWTLISTPWFRWELPVPLYPLLGLCILILAFLVWACRAVVGRYRKRGSIQPRPALDAAMSISLHIGRQRRGASEKV